MSEQAKVEITQESYDKVASERDVALERAQRLEGQVVELTRKVSAFDGIDLAKLKADSEALKLMKDEKATSSKEEFESRLQERERELNEHFEGKMKDLNDKVRGYEERLFEVEVVGSTMNKIGGKFNDDVRDVVESLFKNSLGKDDKGIFIKDEKGAPRLNGAAERMSVEEYAESIIKERPSLAKPVTKNGSGLNGTVSGSGSKTGISPEAWAGMSPEQRKNSGLTLTERTAMHRGAGLTKGN